MTPAIVNTLAFLGAFLAVFAANALLTDIRSSERRRLRERLQEQLREKQRLRAEAEHFGQIAAGARGEAKSPGFRSWLTGLVAQSGMEVSPNRVIVVSVILGFTSGAIAGVLLRSLTTGAVVAVGCGVLPVLYVAYRRMKRIERLRAQLPDAFDLMSRVVRAGQTVTQAMRTVADEFPEPISLEFLYCYEQMNLGLSAEDSLRELSRRTGLMEIKIFVLAVVVHRQTGGNLAELLDKLATVVRDRFRIRGMIKSLTAQGRMQAGILLSLPPVMFVLLMILHPEYEKLLFHYPLMIVAALSMMAAGALWIRRIVNFDF